MEIPGGRGATLCGWDKAGSTDGEQDLKKAETTYVRKEKEKEEMTQQSLRRMTYP